MNKGEVYNSITYDGDVNFTLRRNGRVYSTYSHNAGTKLFRDLICKLLCNDYKKDFTMELPRYIYFSMTFNNTELPLLKSRLLMTSKTYGESVGSDSERSVLLLKTTITYDDLYVPTDKDYSNGATGVIDSILEENNANDATLTLSLEDAQRGILARIDNNYIDGSWIGEKRLIDLYDSIMSGGSGNSTGTDAIIEWRMVFKNGNIDSDGGES